MPEQHMSRMFAKLYTYSNKAALALKATPHRVSSLWPMSCRRSAFRNTGIKWGPLFQHRQPPWSQGTDDSSYLFSQHRCCWLACCCIESPSIVEEDRSKNIKQQPISFRHQTSNFFTVQTPSSHFSSAHLLLPHYIGSPSPDL